MSRIKTDYEKVFNKDLIKDTDVTNYLEIKNVTEVKLKKRQYFIMECVAIILLFCFVMEIFGESIFGKEIFGVEVKKAIQFIQLSGDFEVPNMGLIIVLFFVGAFLHMIISSIIHHIAFEEVRKVYISEDKGRLCGMLGMCQAFMGVIKWCYCYDFKLAKYYKKNITSMYKKNKQCKCNKKYISTEKLCVQCHDTIKFMIKFFVKFSNWMNLTVSISLMGIIIILFIFNISGWLFVIVYSLLLYRLFSRSLEIALAFYKDVVRVDRMIFESNKEYDSADEKKIDEVIYLHGWKNSYIRKPMRISLAVHSFLEILIMFTMVYLLTFVISFNCSQIPSNIANYVSGKYIHEFFLYATSISFFNISYVNYSYWYWNLLHVWQVTMSMVLIILSIAAYIGFEDDVFERERDFFAEVFTRNQKK
ncbi:hypothetical protein ACQVRF_21450 [Bacillus paranthracis]|uniref:hypothetical protein n=1 Tax=Bacillus cereus group TaxID=86661 RepID=UPI0018CD533D|nr:MULTISPECIES: hypothetical protein [Bacillus cereus group]MBJ8350648.1 hypothetical protein [Bacillus mycoides]MDA1620255.1 hypothetical protein [Bacillus cereus group sp. TH204-1LC]MED2900597.1 hypothetical protein [Bacillus tropicus]HDX9599141.1 hypothetical protein [Bacillus cereus]